MIEHQPKASRSLLPAWTTPRMGSWLIITVLLLFTVHWVAPQQLPVDLHKLSLVTMGGVVGYWVDRCAFPSYRPHTLRSAAGLAAAMQRRALISSAALLASAVAV